MRTARTLINAKQVQELTGISASLLKYHRTSRHIKGYRVEGEKEWLYRLDQVNRLMAEHISDTQQILPSLAIVVSSSSLRQPEGVAS
jgi:phage terminase Nu1 subunit (DNA packaging protein)